MSFREVERKIEGALGPVEDDGGLSASPLMLTLDCLKRGVMCGLVFSVRGQETSKPQLVEIPAWLGRVSMYDRSVLNFNNLAGMKHLTSGVHRSVEHYLYTRRPRN